MNFFVTTVATLFLTIVTDARADHCTIPEDVRGFFTAINDRQSYTEIGRAAAPNTVDDMRYGQVRTYTCVDQDPSDPYQMLMTLTGPQNLPASTRKGPFFQPSRKDLNEKFCVEIRPIRGTDIIKYYINIKVEFGKGNVASNWAQLCRAALSSLEPKYLEYQRYNTK